LRALVLTLKCWYFLLSGNSAIAVLSKLCWCTQLLKIISVEELSNFNNELSTSAAAQFKALASQKRFASDAAVLVNVTLDEPRMNNDYGNFVLDEVDQRFTPSRRAGRQAWRSALVLSASEIAYYP